MTDIVKSLERLASCQSRAGMRAELLEIAKSVSADAAQQRIREPAGTAEIGWATLLDWADQFRQAALNSLAGSDRSGLVERARQCQEASDRARTALGGET